VGDDITTGELGRRLDVMNATLGGVQEKLGEAAQRDARDYVMLAEHERRIKGLESWQTWALRVVLGLVIAAVVGVVLVRP